MIVCSPLASVSQWVAGCSGSGPRSVLLAVAYCLGLGVPFVLVALAASRGARGLDVLRRHCDDAGTDYDAIEKTMITMADPVADPDAFLRDMAAYAELGITLVTTVPASDDPVAWTTQAVETVVPRLAEV